MQNAVLCSPSMISGKVGKSSRARQSLGWLPRSALRCAAMLQARKRKKEEKEKERKEKEKKEGKRRKKERKERRGDARPSQAHVLAQNPAAVLGMVPARGREPGIAVIS